MLLGDPVRRAEAVRTACEARIVVEPDDDDRHVGVARPEARAAEQTVVDDDHVWLGPAALARQLLEAAGLGHEGDVRQRAQQSCDRAPAGAETSANRTRNAWSVTAPA